MLNTETTMYIDGDLLQSSPAPFLGVCCKTSGPGEFPNKAEAIKMQTIGEGM